MLEVTSDGRIYHKVYGRRFRAEHKNVNGYLFVQLRPRRGGKVHTEMAHRIVYRTLKGEIPEDYTVHHIDGDRANNHPDNLEVRKDKGHRPDPMAAAWNEWVKDFHGF